MPGAMEVYSGGAGGNRVPPAFETHVGLGRELGPWQYLGSGQSGGGHALDDLPLEEQEDQDQWQGGQ